MNKLPLIAEEQIAMLESLSNACAVSGNEREVRKIVRAAAAPYADEISTDALGNLFVIKKAQTDQPIRVLISAHMDEVGFMLVDEEKEGSGLFRFAPVGGIDPRMLAGKSVLVGPQHKPGLIGACPIHLSTRAEREKVLQISDLRIDVGPGNKTVKVGDFAYFSTKFLRMGSDSVCGKALDNRLGVAVLIELLKQVPEHIELTAVFSVQEEVGLRGASVAAWDRKPDFAFVVDSTPANDFPAPEGEINTVYKSRLGEGPAIYCADGRTLNDPRLIRYLLRTAEKYGIKTQVRQPAPGGTDAGKIHLIQSGCPIVSVSVPGRYAHSAASIARISDWQAHLQLMSAALWDLSKDLLDMNR